MATLKLFLTALTLCVTLCASAPGWPPRNVSDYVPYPYPRVSMPFYVEHERAFSDETLARLESPPEPGSISKSDKQQPDVVQDKSTKEFEENVEVKTSTPNSSSQRGVGVTMITTSSSTPPSHVENHHDHDHDVEEFDEFSPNNSWTRNMHEQHSKWFEFGPFYTFTMFIVITGLTKILFHHAGVFISRIPESCLLIIVGTGVGAFMHAMGVDAMGVSSMPADVKSVFQWPLLPEFTPTLFFAVLLPPIILESAYSLYDRHFANNLSNVLLYAVVGTIFNTFAIGILMWGAEKAGAMGSLKGQMTGPSASGFSLALTDWLVFGSIASAVDPVAVLAIFQELGVNKNLYFLLFGESLLNDAVTVALYSTMVSFTQSETIEGGQYGGAVGRLLAAGCGGATLGLATGLLTALVTRLTRKSRVVEPLAILGIAYLAYMTSELLHLSGIISIITCGLVQAHYAFKNISQNSHITVKYFTKMISSTSDSAIFLFLGAQLVVTDYKWHLAFVTWTLLLCFVCRFAGVFLLTSASNKLMDRHVSWKYQVIIGYGGLRGATCYALARMLDPAYPATKLFTTAALAIVLFTVFLQGASIKFIVTLLKIEKSSEAEETLNEEIHEHVSSVMLSGIEEIANARGDNYIKRKVADFDKKHLQKIFLNPDAENDLKALFERIEMLDHFTHLYKKRLDTSKPADHHPAPTLVEKLATDPLIKEQGSNNKALFMRTFGNPLLTFPEIDPRVPTPALGYHHQPLEEHQESSRWKFFDKLNIRRPFKRRRHQSAGASILHEAMREAPYQKFTYRNHPHIVADDPQEMVRQIRMRRASIVLSREASTATIVLPQQHPENPPKPPEQPPHPSHPSHPPKPPHPPNKKF